MSEQMHDWDAAYVLGALSVEDRRAYEAHLQRCTACREAVAELAGLPGLLRAVPAAEAEALRDLPSDIDLRSGAHQADHVAGAARRIVRRRRRHRIGVGALIVAALFGGFGSGWALLGGPGSSTSTASSAVALRPVADSGLSARLQLASTSSGTRLTWDCSYSPAHTERDERPGRVTSYSLVVHTAEGRSTTVATWSSDDGEASGLTTDTAIPVAAIRSVDIRRTGTSTSLAATTLQS